MVTEKYIDTYYSKIITFKKHSISYVLLWYITDEWSLGTADRSPCHGIIRNEDYDYFKIMTVPLKPLNRW